MPQITHFCTKISILNSIEIWILALRIGGFANSFLEVDKIADIIVTRAITQIFHIVIVICLCFTYHFQSNAEKLESNQVDVIQWEKNFSSKDQKRTKKN